MPSCALVGLRDLVVTCQVCERLEFADERDVGRGVTVIVDILVPLVISALTLAGGWFVTTRVTDHWDQVKRRREMDLAAAADFQRFYGEFFSVWKAWNSISRYNLKIKDAEEAAWECLNRAAEIEGHVEALLARVSAEHDLSEDDIDVLGGVRQGFQSLRREIQRNEPLDWRSSEAKPYLAFKGLASYTSRLLGTSPRSMRYPDKIVAAENFRKITNNRHETSWVETAYRLGLIADS